jgi:ankyrin repeat protein
MAPPPNDASIDSAAIIESIRAGDAARLRTLITENPLAARARDSSGVSALLLARYHRRDDLIEILLSAEPELDIFEASALGRIGRTREILASDPNLVHAWSADGFSALHLAAFTGHSDIVQFLLERGAVPIAPSRNHMAVHPLHSAAAGGHQAAAELLLSYGAQPNARQHGGWTAVHSSAASGDASLTSLLMTHGADPTLKADDGRSAIDLAHEKGHTEVLAVFNSSKSAS